MATVVDWLVMCAETDEFVSNYNRLCGTHLNFRVQPVAPIVAMVDAACGYTRSFENAPAELQGFVAFCVDLWLRMAETAKAEG